MVSSGRPRASVFLCGGHPPPAERTRTLCAHPAAHPESHLHRVPWAGGRGGPAKPRQAWFPSILVAESSERVAESERHRTAEVPGGPAATVLHEQRRLFLPRAARAPALILTCPEFNPQINLSPPSRITTRSRKLNIRLKVPSEEQFTALTTRGEYK